MPLVVFLVMFVVVALWDYLYNDLHYIYIALLTMLL